MSTYYKLHQRGHLWHYIKLLDSRNPKAVEVVNFLNTIPQIYFSEFDLANPSSIIDYETVKDATRIEAWEYEQAYELATREAFEIYVDGKKQ